MIDKPLEDASRTELAAELDLYKRALPEGSVKEFGFIATNVDRAAEVDRLRATHGQPVELTQAFVDENPTLAKLLFERGAKVGDIVFAQEADIEQTGAIEAELKARTAAIAKLKELDPSATDESVAGCTLDELHALIAKAETAKAGAQSAAVTQAHSNDNHTGAGIAANPTTATVIDVRGNSDRTYSLEVHGEGFSALAESYAKKRGWTVRYA